MRIQVLPEKVTAAQQILEAMPNIMKVAPIGGLEGWLRLELVGVAHGDAANVHQINNKILSALIRAKIPILGFEVEGGRLQDVFLRLTEETIK
jgi:hypothetical protein